MRIRTGAANRRLVSGLGLVVAVAIAATPVTLAATKRVHHHRAHAHGVAAKPGGPGQGNDAGAVDPSFTAAVAGLVQNGTIDQSQADAIDTRINAGSIDPEQLVADGVVTDAQMQAVASALDAVKRSFGG